jgi:hypothetical protein
VAEGRLHALHRGVYAVGHAAVSMRGKYLAAVLALGREQHPATGRLATIWDSAEAVGRSL